MSLVSTLCHPGRKGLVPELEDEDRRRHSSRPLESYSRGDERLVNRMMCLEIFKDE